MNFYELLDFINNNYCSKCRNLESEYNLSCEQCLVQDIIYLIDAKMNEKVEEKTFNGIWEDNKYAKI